MRWEKRGQIFNPAEWNLGADIVGYAQSPQALVFDDFVRIYFSSRKRSENGKFISVVRFAEFDRDFKVRRVCAQDILPPAALGTFDEHGIFPINIVRMKDAVYGYTCGWSRRKSVDIDMAIGLVKSMDGGETFTRVGAGPVLTASLNEPFMVGDPFVMQVGDVYHMWYIFGTEWRNYPTSPAPERIYKIAHAISADGITWQKQEGEQIITDMLGEDECQALPTVIKIGTEYHIVFCYRYASDFRTNPSRGYRLGHATSVDLQHWQRDDALKLPTSPGEWDSDMMCYPHLFEWHGAVYLLYNGNEFGKHGFGLAQWEG